MTPTNKRPPAAVGVTPARPKPGVSAQSVKRPVAPPVYKPQSKPAPAQAKVVAPSHVRTPAAARPASSPQARPGVLQQKAAVPQRPTAQPHRPQQVSKSAQAKSIAPVRPRVSPAPGQSLGGVRPGARPVIQRAERPCPWCLTPGCVHGSKCKSTSGSVGVYKGREADQKHLANAFGKQVSGATHQMEHPFGYKVLAGPMHQTGARANTPDTREIEGNAPAYHEEYRPHRLHEGTGSRKEPRESGLNAEEYREWQRTALEGGNLDIAMGINQMTYAHQNLPRDPVASQQASDSYSRMVRNMGPVPLGTHGGVAYTPAPTDEQKFDMLVYRFMAEHHRPPTEAEQLEIISRNGLNPSFLFK